MLPKPDVGQLVRLETYDGRLIVKKVSDDGGRVDLVSKTESNLTFNDVPCLELLLTEDYSAD